MNASTPRPLLVVGAGIAGISAALEAAETGAEVYLIEREHTIGGRVVRNHHYFPKLCPPTCGMEINIQRLEQSPRVKVLTGARIAKAARSAGGWSIKLGLAPQHVDGSCTLCGECSKVCPARVPDPHNLGMTEVPAIRLPHPDAWPRRYALDRAACPDGCAECARACRYDAIDLAATETELAIEVGAMVLATGWRPYPMQKLPELGGGDLKNVIANVQMERMVSPNGPTGGQIRRPSDGEPPRKVAFVQCAGSRDVNHQPYCSAVCCLASLKQAQYVREQLPAAAVTIYYIDRRAPGRNEQMLTRVAAMDGVELVKGKVGAISEAGNGLKLKLEDVAAGTLLEAEADLVVLATGMMPNLRETELPFAVRKDDDGFGVDDLEAGVIFAGVARRPEDVAASVRDATGAAAKAFCAAGRRA